MPRTYTRAQPHNQPRISGCVECGEQVWARGWCRKHYAQLSRKNRECDHCGVAFVGHGRQRWCSTCAPDEQARHRLRRYDISAPEYDALSDSQQGRCALCHRPHAAVDHDPATGRVRGLLCLFCNSRLHVFDHDPDWLLEAAAYTNREVIADAA